MSKLKKYNEFLYEAEVEEVTAPPAQPTTPQPTEMNSDTVDKLFSDLKEIVKKKIGENKKLINEYYIKTTKDGQEINTTDEFYTYGRYTGNENLKNNNMTFVIKFNEPTEDGLTFNVISSLDAPELKDIKSNLVSVTRKKSDGTDEFNPGYISGKYVVKNKDKISLLKPKEETKSEDKPSNTNKPPIKNDNGVKIEVGKFYEYEKEKGKSPITIKVIAINDDKTFQVQSGTAQWPLNTKDLFNKIKKEVAEPVVSPKKKLIKGKSYKYNNTKAKIVQVFSDGRCQVSINDGSPTTLSKEEVANMGEEIK